MKNGSAKNLLPNRGVQGQKGAIQENEISGEYNPFNDFIEPQYLFHTVLLEMFAIVVVNV